MYNFTAKEKDKSIIEFKKLLAEEKKKMDEARKQHQIEVRKQIPNLGDIYYGTLMPNTTIMCSANSINYLSTNPTVTIF
jgi:hypothetical protein